MVSIDQNLIITSIILSLVLFILKKLYDLQKIFNHQISGLKTDLLNLKIELIEKIYEMKNEIKKK